MNAADNQSTNSLLARMLSFEIGLGVLALVLAWGFGLSLVAAFGANWTQSFVLGVLATAPMLMLLFGLESSRFEWVVTLRRFVEEKLVPLFAGVGPGGTLLVALSAGIFEELLFRAVIQQGLSDWLGLWPGLLLASLLFGLAHAMTWSYLVLATL
ncbi:MAG: CPBP family glutamic-type intramembrane protease, partial [Pseudomonadota bacterium]